jgi:hypothetical protein
MKMVEIVRLYPGQLVGIILAVTRAINWDKGLSLQVNFALALTSKAEPLPL